MALSFLTIQYLATVANIVAQHRCIFELKEHNPDIINAVNVG